MVLDWKKSLTVVFFMVVAAVAGAISDNVFDLNDGINVLHIGAAAVLVSLVPNLTGGWAKYTKAIAMGVVAALDAVVQYLVGGVSLAEWLQVVLAVAAVYGVYRVGSNQPQIHPSS